MKFSNRFAKSNTTPSKSLISNNKLCGTPIKINKKSHIIRNPLVLFSPPSPKANILPKIEIRAEEQSPRAVGLMPAKKGNDIFISESEVEYLSLLYKKQENSINIDRKKYKAESKRLQLLKCGGYKLKEKKTE